MNYSEYIERKFDTSPPAGIDGVEVSDVLFPWQADLVRRALSAGRFCLFTDTGTGKTLMQLEWARHVSAKGRVLILAPLAVAEQTSREAKKLGLDVPYRREDDGSQILVANYEMLSHFDSGAFEGIVLDESSILKAYDGRTRNAIISEFERTPFRLACTATPSPNDHIELGNHSEFLGVKSYSEMLAEFFVHDGKTTQAWRIKGHAEELFWRWVCSWAAFMGQPQDLGYSGDGYDLPPLKMHEHTIDVDHVVARESGMLFAMEARTLSEQRAIRRGTLKRRIEICSGLADCDEPVIVWCELNTEGDALEKSIPGAVQIKGSDSPDVKRDRMLAFSDGDIRVMVTKPKIAGFGLNWQHCARVVFVGASHSFEATYQAIRRCWRFGQKRPVNVHVIRAETEGAIIANYRRKEADFRTMQHEMIRHSANAMAGTRWVDYSPATSMEVPSWLK